LRELQLRNFKILQFDTNRPIGDSAFCSSWQVVQAGKLFKLASRHRADRNPRDSACNENSSHGFLSSRKRVLNFEPNEYLLGLEATPSNCSDAMWSACLFSARHAEHSDTLSVFILKAVGLQRGAQLTPRTAFVTPAMPYLLERVDLVIFHPRSRCRAGQSPRWQICHAGCYIRARLFHRQMQGRKPFLGMAD
jgi:hypothetical protein